MTCPGCGYKAESLNCEACYDLIHASGLVLDEIMEGGQPTENELEEADFKAVSWYNLNQKGQKELF